MDIGIIGGADGPTKIFVTSGGNQYLFITIVALIFVVGLIIFFIRFRGRNKK